MYEIFRKQKKSLTQIYTKTLAKIKIKLSSLYNKRQESIGTLKNCLSSYIYIQEIHTYYYKHKHNIKHDKSVMS